MYKFYINSFPQQELIRFQEARDYLLEKYEDQQFIPKNDALRFILIVWLLTNPDAEKANVNVTELESWSWEPIDDVTRMSRGYAQFLFFHGGRIYRPWMRLVRIAWAKLCAEEGYKLDSLPIQYQKGNLVKNFMDNLLRASVKHFPFCGSFLYDVIYGTIDSQKSGKETKVQHEASEQQQIFKEGKTTNRKKACTEKWYQNRTIQAAFIGAGVLLLVSIVGWLISLHINKSKASQDQPESVIAEDKLPLSLREICKDIDRRPLIQQKETAKRYIDIKIKQEHLKLFHLTEDINKGTFSLMLTLPGQTDVSYLTGRKIYCTVDRKQYPQLNAAKTGDDLYVSGQIEDASESYIRLSDVSLSFD